MTNAILFSLSNWGTEPTKVAGSLIDAIEYYLALIEHGVNIELVFVDNRAVNRERFIESLIEERYNLVGLKWREGIKFVNRPSLVTKDFNKVLVVDYNSVPFLRGYISPRQLIVVVEKDHPRYLFNPSRYNVTYLSEIGCCYSHSNYTMKFLFHRMKRFRKYKPYTYVHGPGMSQEELTQTASSLYKKFILKDGFHRNNLFTSYSSFHYIHSGKYFDPHPRLFHESVFQGKSIDITFLTEQAVSMCDGVFSRFLGAYFGDFDRRFFTEQDEVLRLMSS